MATIFFLSLALFLHFREVRVETLELDTVAERYIISQVDFAFPDEEATQIIKQESMRDIGIIYRLNEKQIHQTRFDFESFILTQQKWRDELENVTFNEIYRGADALEEALVRARFTNRRTFQKIQEAGLPYESTFVFSPSDVQKPSSFPADFWEKIKTKAFGAKNIPPEAAQFVLEAFAYQPWVLQEDLSAERSLREFIQHEVPSQFTQVRAGTRIIEPGEKVTKRNIAMLQSMKETIAKERNLFTPRTILGTIILSLLFTFLSILYLRVNHQAVLDSLQKMILLLGIVIITLILSKISEYFLVNQTTYLPDIFRYPIIIPFAALLIFVLVSPEVALFSSAFLTIVLGITLAIDHSRFIVINLIASWTTIILAKTMHKRKDIFSVLGKVWIACIPAILAFNLAQNVFIPLHLFQDFISSFISITVIAVLVIGLLPILESSFHVMTDISLMEYMDPNNELLRRLTTEAPGTYQHCLVVGNLAETAARAIQANGLFCRVATLYHDIGKLFNPPYFIENQLGGFDIHQLLTPAESAQVILAHVQEGEALAKNHHLPESFINIIKEHHGTTLAYFFYHKQLGLMGNDPSKVDEASFRYPGPKPHSKESAIIMLADTLEAAYRSLDIINEETVTEMVEKLVNEKVADKQLDESHLTFTELGTVKKTFIQTLLVTGHIRVKYPEKKEEKFLKIKT